MGKPPKPHQMRSFVLPEVERKGRQEVHNQDPRHLRETQVT